MPPRKKVDAATCEMYDLSLRYAHNRRLPPDHPLPAFTSEWPEENRAVLERYRNWLSGGGASETVIRQIYIPMAGHVLGLNLKLSAQLDLQADLDRAMEYIRAKNHGPDWTDVCRVSLEKFRRFLLHERGQVECKVTPYVPALHTEGLPTWLVDQLSRFQRIQQRNWREARIEENIRRFWCGHLRLWRFLHERYQIRELSDLKRSYFMEYIDWRLASGVSVRGINGDLRSFHGFMAFLQEQGLPVPLVLCRIPCLKEPDPLPRFLTDSQVCALRDYFEKHVEESVIASHRRDALLDRACFYLLWQSGLRRGEVEELRLEDLDLDGRKLTVRRGKGLNDRTVFLTVSVVRVLRDYLAMRGQGPTDHVFLYRNQALSKDLIHSRLKTAGECTGVPVFPHRLRHTCATQLLNAGCRITSIQKFLGHKRLNTTLTYARVHDQTVADDYYMAMSSVEKRMETVLGEVKPTETIPQNERERVLALAEQLALPEVSAETRLNIVSQICLVLTGRELAVPSIPSTCFERLVLDHPPPG